MNKIFIKSKNLKVLFCYKCFWAVIAFVSSLMALFWLAGTIALAVNLIILCLWFFSFFLWSIGVVYVSVLQIIEIEKLTKEIKTIYAPPLVFPLPIVSKENILNCISAEPLLFQVVDDLLITRFASTSYLQRKLKIGYTRAAYIIDVLECIKFVSPFNGSRPRTVLMSREDYDNAIFNICKNHLNNNNFSEHSASNKPLKLIDQVVELVIDCQQISASFLQNVLKIKHEETLDFMRLLEVINFIEPFNGNILRKVLVNRQQWKEMKVKPSESVVSLSPIEQIDLISSGNLFEQISAKILSYNGFHNIEVTQASNDYGVDILAEKDFVKYAIQCKLYSSSVGNSAVQEVNAGKEHYNCHVGVVLTNNHYTPNAVGLANSTKVLLWDRTQLEVFLANAMLAREIDDIYSL